MRGFAAAYPQYVQRIEGASGLVRVGGRWRARSVWSLAAVLAITRHTAVWWVPGSPMEPCWEVCVAVCGAGLSGG
jgi:hypothetical protein